MRLQGIFESRIDMVVLCDHVPSGMVFLESTTLQSIDVPVSFLDLYSTRTTFTELVVQHEPVGQDAQSHLLHSKYCGWFRKVNFPQESANLVSSDFTSFFLVPQI